MAGKRSKELESYYYSASGPSLDGCFFLGQRYVAAQGFKPHEGECWIIRNTVEDDEMFQTLHFGTTGWLTRLWRSDSGAVFASSTTGSQVYYHPDPQGDEKRGFESVKLGAPPEGVWGLSDDFVLVWGATYEETNHLFRFDGKKWKEMKAPDFDVRAIHGIAPDLLYAVGVGGGVARWDGRTWKRFPVPTDEVLNSVFVAGPDEIYATGNAGTLLEGSAHGWGKIGESPVSGMPLLAVARWKKDLWVAGGQFGLFKRVGTQNKLKCVKPNLRAVDLDVRGNLLISCEDVIVETADGKAYTGFDSDPVLEMRAGNALGEF